MVERQQNSVTREMHKRLNPRSPYAIPDVPRALLEWLEKAYPARCYEAVQETLEAHLQYAGKVALVQFLRASFSETSDDIAMSALTDDNSLSAMVEREYHRPNSEYDANFDGTD